MEQLLIFGLILLAVLLDLLVRWGRRTRGGARRTETAEEPILAEEEEDELGWLEPGPVELRLPPRAPAAPFSPSQAPPPPPPRSPEPPPPGARRRRKLGRWLTTADARRGIVLMAVLGPCRGLEPPPGNNRQEP